MTFLTDGLQTETLLCILQLILPVCSTKSTHYKRSEQKRTSTLLSLTKLDLKTLFADKWSPVRTCTDVSVLVSEAVWSKPEQLRSTSVPAMPTGTEKNDIIFFLMNADALRLASNRWGWAPQVDKEQRREGETGGPHGDGWFMDGEKRAEI